MLFRILIAMQAYVLAFLFLMGQSTLVFAQATPHTEIGRADGIAPSASIFTNYGTVHTNTGNFATRPEIIQLAKSLNYDPDAIFEYVQRNIDLHPVFGMAKGAFGSVLDHDGSAFDQVSLASALLKQSDLVNNTGYDPKINIGNVTLTGQQFIDWYQINDAKTACQFLADGGIPASVNGISNCDSVSGAVSSVVMTHAWLTVTYNGQVEIWDPAYKSYEFYGTVNGSTSVLPDIDGVAYSALSLSIQSNSQNGIPYVQNINHANLQTVLTTESSAYNLVLDANGNDSKSLQQIIGGVKLPAFQDGSTKAPLQYAPYPAFENLPNIPDDFRIKLQLNVRQINPELIRNVFGGLLTVYADEIYGVPFSLSASPLGCDTSLSDGDIFDAAEGYCVSLTAGDYVLGNYEDDNIIYNRRHHLYASVDHPYPHNSGGYMDIVAINQYVNVLSDVVIVNGWGNFSARTIGKWARQFGLDRPIPVDGSFAASYFGGEAADVRAGTKISPPRSSNSVRHKLAANWLAQFSQLREIFTGVGQGKTQHHRSFGLVHSKSLVIDSQNLPTYNLAPDAFVRLYHSETTAQDETMYLDIRSALSVVNISGNESLRGGLLKSLITAAAALEGTVISEALDEVDTASISSKFAWSTEDTHTGTDDGINIGPSKFFLFDGQPYSQIYDALLKDGGLLSGGGYNSNDIDYRGLVAKSIASYVNDGYSVVASGETFLGGGPRLGAANARIVGSSYTFFDSTTPADTCVADYNPDIPNFPIPQPCFGQDCIYGTGGLSGLDVLGINSFASSSAGQGNCNAGSANDFIEGSYITSYTGTFTVYDGSLTTLYRSNPNRGGAFVAFKNDLSAIAPIIVRRDGIAKGGGGNAAPEDIPTIDAPNNDSFYNQVEDDFLDGISLQTGEFTYKTNPLLTTGSGGFPYSLNFARTLQSGPRTPDAPLWNHNWNLTASLSSSGLEAMGSSRPDNAVPTIIAAAAMIDLYSGTSTNVHDIIIREAGGSLIMDWWAKQVLHNVVNLGLGQDSISFVRRSDGGFNPPATSNATLIQTGLPRIIDRVSPSEDPPTESYNSREWKYDTINFKYVDEGKNEIEFAYWESDFVTAWDSQRPKLRFDNWGWRYGWHATKWTFINGNIIDLTYGTSTEEQPKLLSVENNLGRKLTFEGYADNPTKVTDETGRSIILRDTEVIMPDGSTVVYRFEQKHMKTSVIGGLCALSGFASNAECDHSDRPSHRGLEFVGLSEIYTVNELPVSSSGGPLYKFQYDDLGNIESHSIAAENEASPKQYNKTDYKIGAGRHSEILSPDGNLSIYKYDAYGRLIELIEPSYEGDAP